MKYGQPPGWRYGEWDFRPDWNYFGERQEDVEVRFDASKEAWQTGAVTSQSKAIPVCHRTLWMTVLACVPHGVVITVLAMVTMQQKRVCRGSGHWYLGVNGDDASTCKYTLSISKYSCPMNCTNRGVCVTAQNNTRTCDCYKVSALS